MTVIYTSATVPPLWDLSCVTEAISKGTKVIFAFLSGPISLPSYI